MKKGILFIGLLLTMAAQAQKEKAAAYIHAYKELAITEMMRSGVPAAITLAQGILESQSGESKLAKVSNNHFGIKCKTEWTGAKTYHDDDEKGECFRVYPSVEDSYRDHSDFLKNRPNYAFLFKLDPTDYEGWASGLKKAGYATSTTYPQKLLKVINDYNLQQYSLEAIARLQAPVPAETQPQVNTKTALVSEPAAKQPETVLPTPGEKAIKEEATKEEPPTTEATAVLKGKKPSNYPAGIFTINHTRVIYAPEGMSLLSLANQYDIPLSRLIEFNELKEMDVLDTDRLLFIERKPKKGATDFHVVAEAESLYDISQQEGLRLESLLEYNHLSKSSVPAKGSKLLLRAAAMASSPSPRTPK